jgi:8-oxo-dGTP pyrophosphatase MutT (NUDIX family)
MNNQKELPILRGEALYIPFVGAIIEREIDNQKHILIQVREKKSDKIYSGSLEIPGGKMQAFEDIYDTILREVKEETNLDVTFIDGKTRRLDYQNREDVSSLIEPFCVTQMQCGPFIGLIFLCQAVGVPAMVTDEAKEARWVPVNELKEIINETPEKIYTAFLAPLKKYIKMMEIS